MLINPTKILTQVQRRFRAARPGSVLILVVALLVLMALIGTAFIATTRTDRYAARQNVANTQIDMLLEGVVNLVTGAITGDLYGVNPVGGPTPPEFRPRYSESVPLPAGAYLPVDGTQTDTYLAPRVPILPNPTGAPNIVLPPPGFNPPTWQGITMPFIAGPGNIYRFDRPNGATFPLAAPGGAAYEKSHLRFVPWYGKLNGVNWPYLRIFNDNTEITPGTTGIPAADTDGDGIADAGLWELPIGTIDGITYYAAVRVIDNNSAVNASMAWEPNNAAAGDPPGNFSPANISLFGMLTAMTGGGPTGDDTVQMRQLNNWRVNDDANPASSPVAMTMYVDPPPASPPLTPPTARPETFNNEYDALWNQLGRRLNNPGFIELTSSPGVAVKTQALSVSETAALAYRFCLTNPSGGASLLEQKLGLSLYANLAGTKYASYPYGPGSLLPWWTDNFSWTNGGVYPNPARIRTILVSRNPVSNQIPRRDMNALNTPGATVTTANPSDPNPDLMLNYGPGVAPAALEHPPKASLNTARFAELWRAFWNVMADGPSATPFDTAIAANGGTPLDPYIGRKFTGALATASDSPTIPALAWNPARMFSSSLRPIPGAGGFAAGSEPPRFDAMQQLLLRAAIAAVNAEDLRDNDDNVTSRRIQLTALIGSPPTATPVNVDVYGSEPQPFITEVYVNTDTVTTRDGNPLNPNGYVAIELFNPYSVDIDMTNWKIVAIDRSATSTYTTTNSYAVNAATMIVNMSPTDLDDVWPQPTTGPLIVPAGGYLLLENYGDVTQTTPVLPTAFHRPLGSRLKAIGSVTTSNDGADRPPTPANSRPGMPQLNVACVPGLSASATRTVLNREMVLLKPRNANGAFTAPDVPNGIDESLNLRDLIPVDSFDFTGLALSGAGPAVAWHYARQTTEWKFVYPGRYDGGLATARHQGIQIVTWVPGTTVETIAPTLPTLGENGATLALSNANAVSTYPGTAALPSVFSIQITNTDTAGPNRGAGVFPFGGFARDGDALQVPYIGGYRVLPAAPVLPDTVLEMNSISMDSIFAEDCDDSDNAQEQIGRFCPLRQPDDVVATPDYTAFGLTASADTPNTVVALPVNDFGDDPALWGPASAADRWRYHWAMDLFDYVTVTAPHDDFTPNAPRIAGLDPVSNSGKTAGDSISAVTTDDYDELKEPVQGQININTAPWKVLAALPMVLTAAGAVDNDPASTPPFKNDAMARAIVRYRDINAQPTAIAPTFRPHGPFKNLFELNRAIEIVNPTTGASSTASGFTFANAYTSLHPNGGGDADKTQGDITPLAGGPDGIVGDFEEKFLAMNRISNLVTMRSDSFTCYILLQGWRGAGTSTPELVAQRRDAFIVDRSQYVPGATLSVNHFNNK